MSHASLRARRAKHLAVLFGTASIGSLSCSLAYAQVNEVLITGSLISGTAAVGIPVTNLGQQDFAETGAINVLELLETVPSLVIPPTNSPAFGGGTLHFANDVSIHGIGVGDTLMMVNGVRWPLQGYDGLRVDPAIFPQIAVERVDVLTAGASATYGADATAGVLNVILKRGFDGAESFLRLGSAMGVGAESVTAAQLYGRTWDGGGLAVSYEHQTVLKVEAEQLFYYTWNFDESGFPGFDFTRIASSNPGIVSDGPVASDPNIDVPRGLNPNRISGDFCANCYSVPRGIGWDYGSQPDGPTTSWNAFQPGIDRENIRNPWVDGWARPSMESNAAVLTFDQRLTPNLNLFGFDLGPVSFTFDGIYSNRRFKQNYPTDQGQGVENMSPNGDGYRFDRGNENPFVPTGLPAHLDPLSPGYDPEEIDGDDETDPMGLRIHWSLDPELDTPIVSGGQVNSRWLAGLEFDDLPFEWHASIKYALTDMYSFGYDRGAIIPNMASAALGNTVTYSTPNGDQVFTKPDSIPYLNPFCDATMFRCNSPVTIAYMQAYRDQSLRAHHSELNVQFDGPLFDLPAGPVVVAAAFNHLKKSQHFLQEENTSSEFVGIINKTGDDLGELSNALIFQANIPLLGTGFSAPMFEFLDVELGYRIDEYDTVAERVYTPKVAVNWGVGWGLTLRGSWGKSFRTPKGEEISASGAEVSGRNELSKMENSDSLELECEDGVAPPGSLTALLNPTCSEDQEFIAPVLLSVSGPPALTAPVLEASGLLGGISTELGPQKAQQYNLGFSFIPGPDHFGGLLNGLNVDVTYWRLKYKDLIASTFEGEGPSDPLSRPYFIAIPNPNAPIEDPSNAEFWELVQNLAAVPTRTQRAPANPELRLTKAILLDLNGNVGDAENAGIDFNARYDFEIGNWGSFHVGATGFYELERRRRSSAGSPWVDPTYGVPIDERVTTGNQLKRVRYRAGWTDGTWNFTTFLNYTGHSEQDEFGNSLLPNCFHAPGGQAGDCYPGSPYYGPYEDFPLHSPATVLVDLTLGYNTGDMPTNEYLRNINIQFAVTNLMDKNPPLGVHPLRSRGTGVVAYDRYYNDLKREVSVSITKTW